MLSTLRPNRSIPQADNRQLSVSDGKHPDKHGRNHSPMRLQNASGHGCLGSFHLKIDRQLVFPFTGRRARRAEGHPGGKGQSQAHRQAGSA